MAYNPNSTLICRLMVDSDLIITMLPSSVNLLGATVTIAAGNVVVEVNGYLFDR